jgi:hypothetical protein
VTDEVLGNDKLLGTYLVVASNSSSGEPRITVLHSLARYSAGFGGQAALHGQVLGFMGEMVGGQLPMMVQFRETVTDSLVHALRCKGSLFNQRLVLLRTLQRLTHRSLWTDSLLQMVA